jgi:dihydrodipicolinate synthase/N-acetylneuraminate lyase
VTLFDPDTDTLDLASQALYYSYLGKQTGLAGLVILGTNAETFLLTREERKELLVLARRTLGPDYPIMAGVGGHSVRQVNEFIADAVEAGADYVLLLPPGYFKVANMGDVVEGFYAQVAEAWRAKGVRIVLYNFPGVCGGVDLDRYVLSIFFLSFPALHFVAFPAS